MATLGERLAVLEAAHFDKSLQLDLLDLCKEDPVFWFDWFCYTNNPRIKPADLPFNLYPFQKQIVRTIIDCIQRGEPLMFEKTRDMGLSWLVMLCFHYLWLFYPGSDFHVGSRLKEFVDKRGVKSTLIEKVRYNHRMLPNWMAPKLDKFHDNVCKLLHPVNGNTITGEAASPDFARSQRYSAVLLDELARLPYGDLAYDSASQSTDCTIGIWTPWGKDNIAYRFASSPTIERIVLTKDEPLKVA